MRQQLETETLEVRRELEREKAKSQPPTPQPETPKKHVAPQPFMRTTGAEYQTLQVRKEYQAEQAKKEAQAAQIQQLRSEGKALYGREILETAFQHGDITAVSWFIAKGQVKKEALYATTREEVAETASKIREYEQFMGIKAARKDISRADIASLRPYTTRTIGMTREEEAKILEAKTGQMQSMAYYLKEVGVASYSEMRGWGYSKFEEEYQKHSGVAVPFTELDALTYAGLIMGGVGVAKVLSPYISKAFVGTRAEMFLIKHSGWYAQRAAKGLVPQVVATQHISGASSFAQLRAADIAWDIAVTPKSSLAMISKAPEILATTPKVLSHLISRSGQISIGYLRELSFQKPVLGGLESERVIMPSLTRYPALQKLPYIPAFYKPVSMATSVLPRAAILTGALGLAKPKIVSPTVPKPSIEMPSLAMLHPYVSLATNKQATKQFLAPISVPSVKSSLIPSGMLDMTLASQTKLATRQVVSQAQMVKQLQAHKPLRMKYQLREIDRIPDMFDLPKKKRKKGKPSLDFWTRQQRLYPVATSKQFMEMFIG